MENDPGERFGAGIAVALADQFALALRPADPSPEAG